MFIVTEYAAFKWGVHCVFYDIPEAYDTTWAQVVSYASGYT